MAPYGWWARRLLPAYIWARAAFSPRSRAEWLTIWVRFIDFSYVNCTHRDIVTAMSWIPALDMRIAPVWVEHLLLFIDFWTSQILTIGHFTSYECSQILITSLKRAANTDGAFVKHELLTASVTFPHTFVMLMASYLCSTWTDLQRMSLVTNMDDLEDSHWSSSKFKERPCWIWWHIDNCNHVSFDTYEWKANK